MQIAAAICVRVVSLMISMKMVQDIGMLSEIQFTVLTFDVVFSGSED